MKIRREWLSLFVLAALTIVLPSRQQPAQAGEKKTLDRLPLLYSEDFEQGAGRWQPTDATAWKVVEGRGGKVYSQHKRRSDYKPPHRSPLNISLLKDLNVADFILTAKVRSTIPDYGHRDVCLFFGYQDAAHFYYVHLGKKADDHANQIFIVDGKPRAKISTKTTPGTNWDDEWHHARIVRDVKSGKIDVYFDNMKTPIMSAIDKKFTWGRVGVGSFDDTGNFDRVLIYGRKVTQDKSLE